MNKTQALIAASLLETAANRYSNHGCNDFALPHTPENEEFVRGMIAASDCPDNKICMSDGKLRLLDYEVMFYCSEILERFADSQEEKATITYFLDYDEDAVIPLSADEDLVVIYGKIMAQKGTSIFVYETKEAMYMDVADFAHQARDGAKSYRHVVHEEMLEMIKKVS